MKLIRLLLNLLICFLIAADSLALLAECAILRPQETLYFHETDETSTISIRQNNESQPLNISIPKLIFYFFYAGGVFNSVAANNIDYAFYALPVGAKKNSQWIDLDNVEQCFPYPLAETYLRIDLEWHKLLGEKSYKAALNSLARKIREKYNREHPKTPMQKVAIYMRWWPRSEKGFTALRYPSNTHWLLLTSEEK